MKKSPRAKGTRCFSVLVLTVVACGPTIIDEERAAVWMVGTWSSSRPHADSPTTHLSYLQIDGDGGVTSLAASCGSDERLVDAEYSWTSAEPGAIEVTGLDGNPMDGGEEPTYLVFRDACQQFDAEEAAYLVHALDGRELASNDGVWARGEVCLADVDEWGVCDLRWCDGEPPPPLPCESDE